MKVIGKTEDGFILEASKDDIAGIQGLYWCDARIKIGDTIDFEGLFRKYSSAANAFNNIEKLRYTATLINEAADWVEQFRNNEEVGE